jgi:hypothetical protein
MRFIILLFVHIVFSQDVSLLKKWEDGPLTIEDFKGVVDANSSQVSELRYLTGYSLQSKNIDGIKVTNYITSVEMYKEFSWLKKDENLEETLLYNQTLFDILEYYSRVSQQLINRISGHHNSIKESVGRIFTASNIDAEKEIERFMNQSDFGIKKDVVIEWSELYKTKLKKTPREYIPDLIDDGTAFVFLFGLGYGFKSDQISNYLDNHILMKFNISYIYHDWEFNLENMSYFQPTLKSIDNSVYDIKKKNHNMISGYVFNVGYRYQIDPKYTIAPKIGYGFLSYFKDAFSYEGQGPVKGSNSFGLYAEYEHDIFEINRTRKYLMIFNVDYSNQDISYLKGVNGRASSISFSIGIAIRPQILPNN